ncbi:MAG TPA: hypothetical protein VKA58_08960, partial [Propionibacteriaceae bacterium]|nr:hypothetical protein [Propionibacteriaceae bacterium]
MAGGLSQAPPQADDLRRIIPVFALIVAIVAAVLNPSPSVAEFFLAVVPVAAFTLWAYLPSVPLVALSFAVIVPVVAAQRSGKLEPLGFEVSLLAFLVASESPSLATAVMLGLLAVAAPIAVSLITDIALGIWIFGIVFPWLLGLAVARQRQLLAQLDATRRELAQQALLAERRGIARDVHD